MRLSAETVLSGDGSELLIYADREGIAYLVSQLRHLGKTDHVDLFTPAWGGDDLTQEVHNEAGRAVHRIKIFLRPDDEPAGILP